MQIGLIGAGNMATALARGWQQTLLISDLVAEKAEQLATEVGGEAIVDNAELASRCDLVVLCHKPGQLTEVATQIDGQAKAVLSILAAVTTAKLAAAYPETPIFRIMPNIAVALGKGAICLAPAISANAELAQDVRQLLDQLGEVVELDETLIDLATGISGVGPAYVALIAEAWAESAVARGLGQEQAAKLVQATLDGSAELLVSHNYDTVALRAAVTSPGGVTEKGLTALEQAELRTAFHSAIEAVVSHDPR